MALDDIWNSVEREIVYMHSNSLQAKPIQVGLLQKYPQERVLPALANVVCSAVSLSHALQCGLCKRTSWTACHCLGIGHQTLGTRACAPFSAWGTEMAG